ncbi:MAG: hypothetical protein HY565_03970 [Candidatus Kerfeldbacteria bacterium]|nr:hypothetical protein [Candidatus Kerfeldbacteria bacterium]
MEQTTTQATPELSQPKKTSWGCIIGAGLGCLWLLVMAAIGIGAVVYLIYSEDKTDYSYDDYSYDDYDYDDIYYDDVVEGTTDVGINDGIAITDPLPEDAYAYQVIAYPTDSFTAAEYPSVQATIENIDMQPLANPDDTVFAWVGATLDNDYFIQVGISSSQIVDDSGNMEWNYFWEMWDAQGNYLYGYQELLSTYGWADNAENKFTITCQDPATGQWEFWVNDEVVGTTNTDSCALDVSNTSLVWELVTTSPAGDSNLPVVTPIHLQSMQYWDGYDWLDVAEATLTYGYGLVSVGTESDPASVCPPYGAVGSKKGFKAGSNLECLPGETALWSL